MLTITVPEPLDKSDLRALIAEVKEGAFPADHPRAGVTLYPDGERFWDTPKEAALAIIRRSERIAKRWADLARELRR